MRILEVRDGFIKFEADSEIYLSAFVKVDGEEKSYIAQVIQLKNELNEKYGIAKILFLLTENGLSGYDRTLPSVESEITEFTSDILCNSIDANIPIIAGKTLNNELNITIDCSAFNKKMLICTDNNKTNNTIIRNLTKQFENLNKKVVIIDTLGVIEAKKYTAGVDFKLPLNTDSLSFLYQDCLNEATADSKSMIVEIFKDLSEYSKTVSFVPFMALKSIVDDMVDSSHVFKLFVLKTKLAKLRRLGYFADNYTEVKTLEEILSKNCVIIDLSKLDNAFQNQFLKYIYSSINNSGTQIILELANSVSKKNIKSIFENNDVATTFVTHSSFKYLNDIKNIFDNFIIEPSDTNKKVFDLYSSLLSNMPKASYLIAGEATNYIPLVSLLTDIDDMPLLEEQLTEEKNTLEEKPTEIYEEEENIDVPKSIPASEIIADIDKKSENVIEQVAENLSQPKELHLFDDDMAENSAEEISDEDFDDIPEESVSIEQDDIVETFNTENNNITIEKTEDKSDDGIENELPKDSNSTHNEVLLEELEKEENSSIQTEDINESSLEEYSLNNKEEQYETVVTQNLEEEIEVPENLMEDNSEDIEQPQESVLVESDELNITEPIAETIEPMHDEIEAISEISEQEQIENELEDTETQIILDDNIDISLDNDETDALDTSITDGFIDYENEISENQDEQIQEDSNDVIPLSSEDDIELNEIVELDSNDIQDNDIIVELDDSQQTEITEEDEQQIVKDVDKVFTTRKDDDITDTDLDFIDEMNNNEEIILEDEDGASLLEPENNEDLEELDIPQEDEETEPATINSEILEKRDASTPIVPVYEAEIPEEDMVISDPIQQGDSVMHAKYGSGVVEKMIKYGSKTLFSINFDNIGRRLLDPTLTEIKKL